MQVAEYLKLYFIMGSNNTTKDPLIVLEQALKGGITLFQFREKGNGQLTGPEKRKLAINMLQLCQQYSVPFIVNDDVSLAIEIGADGVHVGQEDEPVTEVKKRCPSHFIIGVSATNGQQALEAVKNGAEYIGVGPIYSTGTKADAKEPIGVDGLKRIRKLVGDDIPIVAIGGIKAAHVKEIRNAGADGISLISAISQAEKPEKAARELRDLIGYN